MKPTTPFYSHEPDSSIMIKKDKVEVGNWLDDLEYTKEELKYLLEIEHRMLNNAQLYQTLHELKRENQLHLRELYRYDGTIKNALECDTTECDAFYLDKHEVNRSLYVNHLKKYRDIKSKLFSKILSQS